MHRILIPALAFALMAGACSQTLTDNGSSAARPTITTTTTTVIATTSSIASTTTTTAVVELRSDGERSIAGPKGCLEPQPLPSETDEPIPLWVVGIHARMTKLVQDMNTLAKAAWDAAPNDPGWARQEPVASAVEVVESDLTDIREYSTAALEDAGLKWTGTGWTERANTEGPMIEGPIWWLPEGIWSKAEYLKDQILPEYLATTGSVEVNVFYLNGGASSAGPCATTKFMVEAVNGIIRDLP